LPQFLSLDARNKDAAIATLKGASALGQGACAFVTVKDASLAGDAQHSPQENGVDFFCKVFIMKHLESRFWDFLLL
jgi:hypothetical protein